MAEANEEYEGGYDDGLSDALTAIERSDDLDAARIAIKKMLGFVDCPSCRGTGERKEITDRDLIKALLADCGAHVDLSRPCQTCWGEKVVFPKSEAA